jgi:hypothetical protein
MERHARQRDSCGTADPQATATIFRRVGTVADGAATGDRQIDQFDRDGPADVEDPVEFVAVDERQPRAGPGDRQRAGDVQVSGRGEVLEHAGQPQREGARRQQDAVRPRQSIRLHDGCAEADPVAGVTGKPIPRVGVDGVQGGVD